MLFRNFDYTVNFDFNEVNKFQIWKIRKKVGIELKGQ